MLENQAVQEKLVKLLIGRTKEEANQALVGLFDVFRTAANKELERFQVELGSKPLSSLNITGVKEDLMALFEGMTIAESSLLLANLNRETSAPVKSPYEI